MKRIAIIGGGRMACIFAEKAKEMGIETHCFSLESGAVDKNAFDFFHPINILNRKAVLNICKKIMIDGVIATTEITIAVAAFIASKMNLVGIPVDIAEKITDKYRNRIASKNVEGLQHPKYAKVSSVDEIIQLGFTYPIILKPTSKGGKRGITVINGEGEIKNAFAYALIDGGMTPLIVEEYIDGGMEYSVESLSFKGHNFIIQVTEKLSSGAPHCVELGHHQPATMSVKEREKVERVLDQALTAIGIENGPCHTEIKIKNDNIYLIEFNARTGGDHIAHPLTELSTGYSYVKGAIEIALGTFSGVKKSTFLHQYAGILFITEQTKNLKSIFDKCESYHWFYKKNVVSNELSSIVHNDGFNTNYFIYCDSKKPNFNG